MKSPLALSMLILIAQLAPAQTADSLIRTPDTLNTGRPAVDYSITPTFTSPGTTLTTSYATSSQKRWISRGSIIFATYNLQLSAIEIEILDMEGLERNALLKRDISALKNIWMRDFTLDDPQNEIVTDDNPIPYYISLGRMVENSYHADNAVYTSGLEFFQKLNTSGKVEDRVERKFFHTWTRAHGVWKLSSKSHK